MAHKRYSKGMGWHGESRRHSLARRGIKTGKKVNYSTWTKKDINDIIEWTGAGSFVTGIGLTTLGLAGGVPMIVMGGTLFAVGLGLSGVVRVRGDKESIDRMKRVIKKYPNIKFKSDDFTRKGGLKLSGARKIKKFG